MPDTHTGEIVYPRYCQASAARNGQQIALTFHADDRTPLTIVLPISGAAEFQRNLAQAIFLLTARPSTLIPPKPDISTESPQQ